MSDRLRSTGETAGDERQMEAWILAVRSLLEGRLDLVFEQAIDLGNRYLQALREEHQGMAGNRKNPLQLRVRQRGHAIALEWYRIYWQSANGQEQRLQRLCRRTGDAGEREGAPGASWHLQTLLRHTSGWEKEVVTAMENEADEYRWQAHYLAELLGTLDRLERCVQAQTPGRRCQDEPEAPGAVAHGVDSRT